MSFTELTVNCGKIALPNSFLELVESLVVHITTKSHTFV